MCARIKEGIKTELKREVTEELKKEIIAFANTNGGEIYVGIDNNSEVIGINDVDIEVTKVTNMVRDSIRPDMTMFINYFVEDKNGKKILRIVVNSGNKKPYYIYSKGLKPSGVFVRQGLSAVPASEDNIRKMIKEMDGDSYEKMRSVNQSLTFNTLKKAFNDRGIQIEESNMQNLGIITKDEKLYTNLGLLLSEQALHTIKIAVFQGKNKSIFRDRREFSGSVLNQLEEVYKYIKIFNKKRGEIKGLYRNDNFDYPEVAIREVLLNAIVHREYSLSGSILISIFDDRIEFVTIGGLVSGISIDDILLGISQTRNERLANIFYRLELIEAYGTGISKIINSYKGKGIDPKFEATNNAFKVTLFNSNNSKEEDDFSESEEIVLRILERNERIIRKDVEKALGVSQTMAGRVLKGLIGKGKISKHGSGSKTYYLRE